MPRTSRRKNRALVALFLISLIGAAILSGGIGYLIATDQAGSDRVFSSGQQEFVFGLVAGTRLRDDSKSLDALKAICAGRFYPDRPDAMAGCVAGLSDPPKGGYRLPR